MNVAGVIRLALDKEGRNVVVNALGYQGDWPPPETLDLMGLRWVRETYSTLPEDIPGIVRGALYVFSEVFETDG